MNLQQHKQKLLKTNPAFKSEYERFNLWFEMQQMALRIRSLIKWAMKKEGGT